MLPSLAYIMASTAMDMIKDRPELWEKFRESCGLLFKMECGERMDAALLDQANKKLWQDFDKIDELIGQVMRVPDAVLNPPAKTMSAKG